MGNNRQTGHLAVKKTVLRDVCHDSLIAEPSLSAQQSGWHFPGRTRWMRIAALLLVLLLAGFAAQTVFRDSAASVSSDRMSNADISSPLLVHGLDSVPAPSNEDILLPYGRGADPVSGVSDYRMLLEQPDVAIAELFGLGVHTIVIDAGHGGEDPGAIGANGLMEKDITLKIARLLRDRLEGRKGINAIMTRDADVTLSLKQRVEYARQHEADLLVSIHLNTIPDDPMIIVETYYFGPPADAQSMTVAKKENYHSGYAMAEFRELIAGLGDTLKQQESRKLASHIQKNIYETLGRHNRDIINVGIKTAPFVVLLGAEIPSVLAEVTCISNTEEEARLATPAYRDKIAGALERGILSYLKQSGQQDRQRPEQESNIYAES